MRSQSSFLQFPQKILLFTKKLFNMKIFSIQFSIKKVIFIFRVRWPLFLKNGHVQNFFPLKNGHVPPKFFPHFLQKCCLFRKNCEMKNYSKPHFPVKKGCIHFHHWTSPFLQKRLGPQKLWSCRFLRKYSLFWKNY